MDGEDSATDNAILAALKKMDVKMNKMSASSTNEISSLKVEIKQVRDGLMAAQAGQAERGVRFQDQKWQWCWFGGSWWRSGRFPCWQR